MSGYNPTTRTAMRILLTIPDTRSMPAVLKALRLAELAGYHRAKREHAREVARDTEVMEAALRLSPPLQPDFIRRLLKEQPL